MLRLSRTPCSWCFSGSAEGFNGLTAMPFILDRNKGDPCSLRATSSSALQSLCTTSAQIMQLIHRSTDACFSHPRFSTPEDNNAQSFCKSP